MSGELLGSIEAGGTKFNCAVGTPSGELKATRRIPTTTPTETLNACREFFKEQSDILGAIAALGICAFGPLDLNKASPTYGSITKTPKPNWSHVNLVKVLGESVKCPVEIDTDVNGAALAELKWGAGKDLTDFIYLTVGTGVGGGAVVNGKLAHGLVHPEMGHIRIVRDPEDSYPGICSFHGDCLEGMVSGPAFKGRWGEKATSFPMEHPAWRFEAYYLAQALVNYICILSPQRIIIGGGMMHHDKLFPMIRTKVLSLLNGYVNNPSILSHIDQFIVPPHTGDNAGMLGGLALAELAL